MTFNIDEFVKIMASPTFNQYGEILSPSEYEYNHMLGISANTDNGKIEYRAQNNLDTAENYTDLRYNQINSVEVLMLSERAELWALELTFRKGTIEARRRLISEIP